MFNLCTVIRNYSDRVEHNQRLQLTRSEYYNICIIKLNRKMDAMPSFGVTMISEVPSNPQLTLVLLNTVLCNFQKVNYLLYVLKNCTFISGERPYKCDLCDKSFARLQNLQEHNNRHLGVRPYQCSVCEKCKLLHT